MTGDVRAMHLLFWAKVGANIDADMLVWALRNVGGDKIYIITQLFRYSMGSGVMDRHIIRVLKEVQLMKDEAKDAHNSDQVSFVTSILESPWHTAGFDFYAPSEQN
jgi:hypothetical protein